MSIAEHDQRQMNRALELAQRGIGLCAPNPIVGCVILDSIGELAGEGWHEYDLRDHAEVAALKVAGNSVRGGTAYVTLEPCNHTGRTGPCTQALINAGIKRVVAATIDPNTQVAGHGIGTLRAAGIETSIGICEPEARRLNEPFAKWSQHKLPFVLMKVAMSLDGRIAPSPAIQRDQREPHWITGEWSRAAVQQLRWQSDAVLTGIDTVLADDPLLTDRSGQRRRRPLLRIVLDSQLRLPLDSKLVHTAQNDVLVFTISNDQARISELTSRGVRVEVLPAQSNHVPLDLMLQALGSEGILSLLTETGSRLNTAFLAAGLVDRIQCFIAPQIMGSAAVPAFCNLGHPLRLSSPETQQHGDDLSITSLLRDPWQNQRAEIIGK
jgi:diaminohydroxyphosphoribosylaminopyrimidine deaminase/5-amino-6-(5-phosphoribosylamino)uracil reductase